MDATEVMSAIGTVILIASIVVAVLVSVLLLIVSIWPNFMNNWKNPGERKKQHSATAGAPDHR